MTRVIAHETCHIISSQHIDIDQQHHIFARHVMPLLPYATYVPFGCEGCGGAARDAANEVVRRRGGEGGREGVGGEAREAEIREGRD